MKFDLREKMKSEKFWANVTVIIFALAVNCLLMTADCFAQGGSQHYGSPLYSPRVYEADRMATTSDGLPSALNEVGIEQKLNEQLPLDTKFVDETGREVVLGEYFGKKPVVLALVYYECPMLCNEVLNGLTRSLKGMNFTVGKEFDVVAVSFDPKDRPEIARAKKESYIAKYGNAESAAGWHFLTGTPESIEKITRAVGFRYRWDEESKQFAHAGGIQVVTPEGKLARYFYGIDYAPKEVKFGLMEASASKIGNPVDQLLLYCFHYDPSSGKYGLAIMRVVRLAGLVTIFGLAAMLFVLWRYNGQNRNEKTA
jgi:protein SCO1